MDSKQARNRMIQRLYNLDWDEEDHPRDDNGRFSSGGSKGKEWKDINKPYVMSADRQAEKKPLKRRGVYADGIRSLIREVDKNWGFEKGGKSETDVRRAGIDKAIKAIKSGKDIKDIRKKLTDLRDGINDKDGIKAAGDDYKIIGTILNVLDDIESGE